MTDDKDLARQQVLKEWRQTIGVMRGMNCPVQPAFYDGHDFSGWPDGDGEGMLVPITIGARGNLSRGEAKKGAAMWHEVIKRYPKAYFVITLLGYNEDPRDVWEFRDARRYVRWWARLTGLDDIATAERFFGLSSPVGQALGKAGTNSIGFLAACGVFGEELRQTAVRGRALTIPQ